MINKNEIYELLKVWSKHLTKPFTHSELLDFAKKAKKYPLIFNYGRSVPIENVYRGYRELSLSAATELCGGRPFSGENT